MRLSKRTLMIQLRNIHKSYGQDERRLHVLKGINLDIADGQMVSIMGSSGSGKSTLLNILGLLDSHDQGTYRLADIEIKNLSESQAATLRNHHIGFVFQSFNLLPFKNAIENVALPLFYQKVGRRERNRKATEMLAMVGLADRAEHMPNQMSGGQKQRVAIARALITNPQVILADEPTGALDSATSSEVMALFREIHARGKTLIIVTHEQDIANQTERIITLKDGLIIHDSSPIAETAL
jgi:putative ABC transport system ATP-binding protein